MIYKSFSHISYLEALIMRKKIRKVLTLYLVSALLLIAIISVIVSAPRQQRRHTLEELDYCVSENQSGENSVYTIPNDAPGNDIKNNDLSFSAKHPLSDLEDLFFDFPQDLSNLNLGYLTGQGNTTLLDGVTDKTIDIHFSSSQCTAYYSPEGFTYIDIEGLKPTGSPGEPLLPSKTLTVHLPLNAELLDLQLEECYYREFSTISPITPAEIPYNWSYPQTQGNQNYEKILLKKDIYGNDTFFPGNILSYLVGKNTTEKFIFIYIYPLQFNPVHNKAILVTDAKVKVSYSLTEKSHQLPLSSAKEPIDSINVIITPPSFYHQAMELKDFHDSKGTPTHVINTTWIDTYYLEANDPPYEGYKDYPLVIRYNYNLAKKIICYLDDTTSHPNLKYVTLLGTALLVPPSYYYYDLYNGMIPTDFFYGSPDYDLVPNYYVGRLPVFNEDEAMRVINKIKNWEGTETLFQNVSIGGGQPFDTNYFIGEMMTQDTVNRGFFDGSNVTKYFLTEKNFDQKNFTHAFSGQSGIVYHVGHGNRKVMATETDTFTVPDIMAFSPHNTNPIVLSIACDNAAYDTRLVYRGCTTSIGEAFLLSEGGGIAFIGGSRLNQGSPIFMLDRGSVRIIKESYMGGLLTYTLQAYHDGKRTLGYMTSQAMITYVTENNMTDPINLNSFFSFTLLGDPTLKIPIPAQTETHDTPHATMENPEGYTQPLDEQGTMPIVPLKEVLTVHCTSDSPALEIKIIDTENQENFIIDRLSGSTSGNIITAMFTPNISSLCMLRFCTKDHKEEWLYYYSTRCVDDDYTSSVQGWNDTRFATLNSAIQIADKNDIIYIFNGTYYEHVLIEKPIRLIGEHNKYTIIDGTSDGDVITIKCSPCMIYRLTLENGGRTNKDGALKIQVDFRNNNGSITIDQNIIQDSHKGIFLYHNRASTSISDNILTNNTFALYSLGSNTVFFDHNLVRYNTCGIYLRNSMGTSILLNDFISNGRHAKFWNSFRPAIWLGNYWDNWGGQEREYPLPKLILGKRGIIGLIPCFKWDIIPSYTPNTYP